MLARLRLALQASLDGVWDLDLKTRDLTVCFRWTEISGICYPTLEHWVHRIHLDQRDAVHNAFNAALSGTVPCFEASYQLLNDQGAWRWVHVRGLVERDDQGVPLRAVGIMRDIAAMKEAEEALFRVATHDALTGLPNRDLFLNRVQHAIARFARDAEHSFGVLFVDLSRFKHVNDTFGHAVGDALLSAVAERLQADLRAGDTVARLGGDEFGVILEGVRDTGDANVAAARIGESLARPFLVEGHNIQIGGTVGAVVGSTDSTTSGLIRDADAAMYEARRRGGRVHQVADDEIKNRIGRRSRLAFDLQEALRGAPGLRAVWQPIVELPSGRVASYEALARWRHPAFGDVSPAEFVPLAEERGLADQFADTMTRLVVDRVERLRLIHANEKISFHLNITGRNLHDVRFVDRLVCIASDRSIAGRLVLEITETVLIDRPERVGTIMRRLSGLGYRFALDDFGAGFSSLSHWHNFPVEIVKIDGSFVRTLTTDDTARHIVVAVTSLAKATGKIVIAEGVETVDQFELLQELGVGYAQGYLFSRPFEPLEVLEAVYAPR